MKVPQPIIAMMFLSLVGCASVKTAVQPSWNSVPSRRVAVLPFKGDSKVSEQLSDTLVTELMDRGFTVVERAELAKIVQEHSLQYTGGFDPSTVSQNGKLSGADLIVIGSVSTRQVVPPVQWFLGTGETITQIDTVTVRWVSVRSGQVVASAQVHNNWGKNLSSIVARIVQSVDGAIQANADRELQPSQAAAPAQAQIYAALPQSN